MSTNEGSFTMSSGYEKISSPQKNHESSVSHQNGSEGTVHNDTEIKNDEKDAVHRIGVWLDGEDPKPYKLLWDDLASLDDFPYEDVRGQVNKKTGIRLGIIDKRVTRSKEELFPAKESQSQTLLNLVRNAEVFHTPDKEAYCSLLRDDVYETWSIKDKRFKTLLQRMHYIETGRAPAPQAISDALSQLEARAIFDGQEKEVFNRTARHGDDIYIFLANEAWEAIWIKADGWQVVSDYPVKFCTPRSQKALPTPVEGGSIDELRRFVNIADEDWPLLVGWLLAASFPTGPYPVLNLSGEHGNAKSMTTRVLRSVVDPSTMHLASFPKSERDLAIRASNSQILDFDNVSSINESMSDALCRLATGGGSSTRALYTDSDEVIFKATRPIMINGIGNIIYRHDLLDRTIIVTLPCIPDSERRTVEEIDREFDEARPRILGALCNAIACALKHLPNHAQSDLPRMADFVKLVSAAESALGWPKGNFRMHYDRMLTNTVELALESDSVAVAVLQYVKHLEQSAIADGDVLWSGTATDLLSALKDSNPGWDNSWPKTPKDISSRLRRAVPFLRETGVRVEFQRTRNFRSIIIRKDVVYATVRSIKPVGGSSDAGDAGDAKIHEPDDAAEKYCQAS